MCGHCAAATSARLGRAEFFVCRQGTLLSVLESEAPEKLQSEIEELEELLQAGVFFSAVCGWN